jgi:hypothetical protein
MSSIRFVRGQKPQIIEGIGDGKKIEYQAGQLALIGLRGIPGVTSHIKRYLKEAYGWTQENQDDLDLDAQGVSNLLLSDESIILLACDYTEKLKPADLIEWDEDFYYRCFDAAVEANPKFVTKTESASNTGQAQNETHKEDGTPKTAEETPKN